MVPSMGPAAHRIQDFQDFQWPLLVGRCAAPAKRCGPVGLGPWLHAGLGQSPVQERSRKRGSSWRSYAMVQVNRWMDNGMLSRSISLEIRDAKPNTCLSHSFSKNHACGFPVLLGFQARNAQDLSGANSMYFSGHCSVKLPWLCGSISFGVIFLTYSEDARTHVENQSS